MAPRFVHLLCALTILLLAGQRACAQQATGTPGPFTIVAQPANGRLNFELDGHPLSGDLLDALNKQFAKIGPNRRVNILFHQDTKLTDVFLTMATVGKVGFADSHMYVFDKKRLIATEMHFEKEQAFTLNP